MDKALFEKYAELKRAEKDIEAQLVELNPKVVEAMGENEEVATDFGLFAIGHRRKWKYSAEVEAEEKKVKELKKEAERLGTADYEETNYLIFRTETE